MKMHSNVRYANISDQTDVSDLKTIQGAFFTQKESGNREDVRFVLYNDPNPYSSRVANVLVEMNMASYEDKEKIKAYTKEIKEDVSKLDSFKGMELDIYYTQLCVKYATPGEEESFERFLIDEISPSRTDELDKYLVRKIINKNDDIADQVLKQHTTACIKGFKNHESSLFKAKFVSVLMKSSVLDRVLNTIDETSILLIEKVVKDNLNYKTQKKFFDKTKDICADVTKPKRLRIKNIFK